MYANKGQRSRPGLDGSTPLEGAAVAGWRHTFTSAVLTAIGAGSGRDSTNTTNVVLPSPVVLSTAFVGPGGLDAGAVAALTHYAVYAINATSGNLPPSAVLSTSYAAPALPAGYDVFAFAGSQVTDTLSAVRDFRQVGAGSLRTYRYADSIFTRDVIVMGAATVPTAVSCATLVPPPCREATLHARQGGNGALSLFETTTGPTLDALDRNSEEEITQLLDAARMFAYENASGAGRFSGWVMGFPVTL